MNSAVSSEQGQDRWASILKEASNKPSKKSPARIAVVPLVSGLVAIVVLLVLNPPFVCVDNGKPGMMRLLVWGIIAASLTCLLTHQGVFASVCSVHSKD